MDSALACRLQSPDCLRTFRSLWGEPFDSFLMFFIYKFFFANFRFRFEVVLT